MRKCGLVSLQSNQYRCRLMKLANDTYLMSNIYSQGVSQIAKLVCLVHKCIQCVRTEKYGRVLVTLSDRHVSPFTNATMVTQNSASGQKLPS